MILTTQPLTQTLDKKKYFIRQRRQPKQDSFVNNGIVGLVVKIKFTNFEKI